MKRHVIVMVYLTALLVAALGAGTGIAQQSPREQGLAHIAAAKSGRSTTR